MCGQMGMGHIRVGALVKASIIQVLNGWLRTQRMVKESTDGETGGQGLNEWTRAQRVVNPFLEDKYGYPVLKFLFAIHLTQKLIPICCHIIKIADK